MDQIPQTTGYPDFELKLRGSRIPKNFNYDYVVNSLVRLRQGINTEAHRNFREYNAKVTLSWIVHEIHIHNRSSIVLADIFSILPLTDIYVQENFEYLKGRVQESRTILHIILELMAIEAHYYHAIAEA